MIQREDDKGADTEAGQLMRAVMARLGVATVPELGKALGGEWVKRDPERKLYKWYRGQAAPNYASTMMLIRRAGWLNIDAGAPASEPTPLDPLGAIAAGVAALELGQKRMLELLEDRSAVRQSPRRATPKASGQ